MKYIFYLFLLTFSNQVLAQNLQGKVIDNITGDGSKAAAEFNTSRIMSDIIDRVTRMENILDELAAVVAKSAQAMDELENHVEKLNTIKKYYESQYMKDWSADERGELPKDLKRGVLSEDGINTASITCTTPLSATRSVTVTLALLMKTPSPLKVTITSFP